MPLFGGGGEKAGYPAGTRHECMSVAMLPQSSPALTSAQDPQLVCHLIGTHHGRGRPFIPVVRNGDPVEVELTHGGAKLCSNSCHCLERLDSGWVDRFWELVRRYGPWGLAFLEAILQLADHQCSEEEQVQKEKP